MALPRLGWVAAITGLVLGSAIQGHAGAALILGLAAMLPIVLMPLKGTSWSLSAGAPALGLIGVAGAWPALAGRATTPWRRAVLGAIGWVWLVLASSLTSRGLYLDHLPAMTTQETLHQTLTEVLRPILSGGVLAGAPVWALAAVTLPWFIRRRSPEVDAIWAIAWVIAFTAATAATLAVTHSQPADLPPQTAAIGALVGVVIAVAPSFLARSRAGRMRRPGTSGMRGRFP